MQRLASLPAYATLSGPFPLFRTLLYPASTPPNDAPRSPHAALLFPCGTFLLCAPHAQREAPFFDGRVGFCCGRQHSFDPALSG
jgi:hypothetical protein